MSLVCFFLSHRAPPTQAELATAIIGEGFTCARCREFINWHEMPRRVMVEVIRARTGIRATISHPITPMNSPLSPCAPVEVAMTPNDTNEAVRSDEVRREV